MQRLLGVCHLSLRAPLVVRRQQNKMKGPVVYHNKLRFFGSRWLSPAKIATNWEITWNMEGLVRVPPYPVRWKFSSGCWKGSGFNEDSI